MATRHQDWSRLALDRLTGRKGEKSSDFAIGKYKTRCLSTPSLLQAAGLVQGLTFIVSRDKTGQAYADDLAHTYAREAGGPRDWKGLLQVAQRAELSEYMALSADLIQVATWFRRFAQSELDAVKEDEG